MPPATSQPPISPAATAAEATRPPPSNPSEAMRLVPAPALADDLDRATLLAAIEAQIAHLERAKSERSFRFGPRVLSQSEYLRGLRRFVALARAESDDDKFFAAVRREFDFYEVYGQKEWGDVFITAYYEPVLDGALTRTARFSQPIYKLPADIVSIELSSFDAYEGAPATLRGRLQGAKLVPYYSRGEIDSGGALAGRNLEICWMDPLDAFVLHTEGSGAVDVGGGRRLRLGFAGKNGRRHESLSKFLKGVIPADKLNFHTIEDYLRGLPERELRRYLERNPSYVFFQVNPAGVHAITSLGVPATAGRSIATDARYFPKGALALLVATQPEFPDAKSRAPSGWRPLSRFVLDQDTGGGILGAGRVDLFWGEGADAGRYAGVMKQRGRLYYLAPK